jgi:signal transduction histidine kinase
VLFLGTTLGFWAALGWLGVSTLQQDRTLEEHYLQTILSESTDGIAAEIRRNLADVQLQFEQFSVHPAPNLPEVLSAYSRQLPADAVIVAFQGDTVQAFPRQRLLYYPVLPAADAPSINSLIPSRAYAEAATNPHGAVELFQSLAQTDDPRARAEALLALARAQSKVGRIETALNTYASVQDPEVLVDGRPAELFARLGRCELLLSQGRRAELIDEAQRVSSELNAGRWQLTRAAYLQYAQRVRELLGSDTPTPDESAGVALALTEGVSGLWEQWQENRSSPTMIAGRESRRLEGQPVFLLWRATSDRLVALIAGRTFLEDRLLASLRGTLDRLGVHVVLEDSQGVVLSHGSIRELTQPITRTMQDTQLPWILRVVRSDPSADRAPFAFRRRLIIAGLVFLALFVVAGSYLSVRAMRREIEAAQLKSDFVAAVSHEFRTPLTLLRQFSDLLADDRVSSEQERRRYYAALQRGTRRLTRLVEDLLDFGRMEAGSRAFTLKPVELREWMLGLIAEFREEVHSKGYTIETTWEGPAGVTVDADEAAIGRALWNLLDNAVKYSPNYQTVLVSGRYEDGRATISVRDRGLGVSAHEQRAIFGKFVRGSATSGHGIRGTGLGLAMVEQIVEAHGGTVHLESTVGEGSTFSITLPARLAEPAQAEATWLAS